MVDRSQNSFPLPPCFLQPYAHLPVFTPSLNSLPSPRSHSAVPLCFLTYYLRCDASIAKLSADVSSGEQRRIRLQQEVAELRSAVDIRLKELEVKVRNGASALYIMYEAARH